MPDVDSQLGVLSHGVIFTTLDLSNGFLQIPLTPEAKSKTAFVTYGEIRAHALRTYRCVGNISEADEEEANDECYDEVVDDSDDEVQPDATDREQRDPVVTMPMAATVETVQHRQSTRKRQIPPRLSNYELGRP